MYTLNHIPQLSKNIRKHRYSNKYHKCNYQPLSISLRIKISKPNSGQTRECKIHAHQCRFSTIKISQIPLVIFQETETILIIQKFTIEMVLVVAAARNLNQNYPVLADEVYHKNDYQNESANFDEVSEVNFLLDVNQIFIYFKFFDGVVQRVTLANVHVKSDDLIQISRTQKLLQFNNSYCFYQPEKL